MRAKQPVLRAQEPPVSIAEAWDPLAQAVLYHGDCKDFLASIPAGSAQLVVTSPPYNIGKSYESRRRLEDYVADQA